MKNFLIKCLVLFMTVAPSFAAHAEPHNLRLAYVFSTTSTQHEAAQRFAQLVEERSNKRFTVSLFPNGQLGGDEALGRALANNTLDLSFLSQGSLSGVDALLDFYALPYIAPTYQTADALILRSDGVIQSTLREALGKHNIISLAPLEIGFRGFSNSKRPVHTQEDMRGIKIRVPGLANIRAFFNALKVQNTVIPYPDLFNALQQGTVDGQEGGINLFYPSRLFEAQKYFTSLNHVYDIATIVAGGQFWNELSPADRALFQAIAEEVSKGQIQASRQMTSTYITKLEEAGISIVTLTDDEMKPFKTAGQKVWEQRADVYGKERIAALLKEVEAASAQNTK